MKKNWILRLGVLAMVLTLVTMPMVSSTYAKYVTSTTGTDTARVARWGVTLTSDVTPLFGDAYATGGNAIATWANASGDASELSVVADTTGTEVLAPGTGGSFTFTITGTPEVALNLNVEATVTREGWTVVSNDYEPVKFVFTNGTLFWNGTAWQASSVQITATQLQAGLLSLSNAEVDTNTNLATMNGGTGTYTVTWVWLYTTAGSWKTFDDIDTLLYTYNGVDTYTQVANEAVYSSSTTYYIRTGAGTVADPYVYSAVPATTFTATGAITYDAADTFLGNLGSATLAITLNITATQIN